MLASLAFQRGDCPRALVHFQRSGTALQQAPSSLAQFGDCLIRDGRPQAAAPVFQQWLTLDPGSNAARFDVGLSQYLNHQDHAAIDTLTPLLQPTPPRPDGIKARVNLLNLLAAAEEGDHQTARAVAHLHEAIELAPRDPRNYLDLATISLTHRSYQVGIDVLNAGLQALPGNASLAVARGVLYAQTGHFAEAEADFRHAERAGANVDAQRSAATVGMGIALMQTDHIDDAIALLHQKLAQAPGNPDLNFLLAVALQRKGMTPGSPAFRQAQAALQKALQARPRFAAARDELSALELREREPAQAAEDALRAMQLDPQNPSPVYHRMMALRQLGKTADAAKLARQLGQLQAAAQQRELVRNRVRLVETPGQR
jgi:tetratricopeptide (TPR) repeat protein